MENKPTPNNLLSPLLISDVECPVCFTDKIKYYALRAKSLPNRPNVFEVPVFEESKKYEYVDFNELIHNVCPNCKYTATKKTDFNTVDSESGRRIFATTKQNIITHWQNNPKEVSTAILDCFVNDKSFLHPRNSEGVIASYKLAIYKSTLEINLKIPFSFYKRAKNYLKLYYIHNKYYKNYYEEYLLKASQDLEEVFKLSDFPEKSYEYEVCYLLIAIYIRTKQEGKAGSFIKTLDMAKGELVQKSKDNPSINLQDINKWLTKAKTLWQSKGEEDVWKLNKPLNF